MADNQKSVIEETYHTIIDRLKSPFGFAFLMAWLFTNWKLVFVLFHLPEGYYYFNKIAIIKFYIAQCEWTGLLLFPALEALAAVFFFYIFSLLASGISLWNE